MSIIFYLVVVTGIPTIINEMMEMTTGSNPLVISLITLYLAAFFVPGFTSLLEEYVKEKHKQPYIAPSEEMTWVMTIAIIVVFLINSNGFSDIMIAVTIAIPLVYRTIEHVKNPNDSKYAGIYPLSVVFSLIYGVWTLGAVISTEGVSREDAGFLGISIFGLTGISLIIHGELSRTNHK